MIYLAKGKPNTETYRGERIVNTVIYWVTRFLARPLKLQVFFSHLLLSATAVAASMGLAWWLWYPKWFFMADGGWEVSKLILAVDVVLGPLLTLAVFERGKRGVHGDMILIALMQIGALTYGISTMIAQRPAALVLFDEQFQSVTFAQIEQGTRDPDKRVAWRRLTTQPLLVLHLDGVDRTTQVQVKTAILKGGPAPYSHGDYYISREHPAWLPSIVKSSVQLEELVKRQPHVKHLVEVYLQRVKMTYAESNKYLYLPTQLRYDSVLLVLDPKTGDVTDWIR